MLLLYDAVDNGILRCYPLYYFGIFGIFFLKSLNRKCGLLADKSLSHFDILVVDSKGFLLLGCVIETLLQFRHLHLELAVVSTSLNVDIVELPLQFYVLTINFRDLLAQVEDFGVELVLDELHLALLVEEVDVERLVAGLVDALQL